MKNNFHSLFNKVSIPVFFIFSLLLSENIYSQQGSGKIMFKTTDGIKYPIDISASDLFDNAQNVYTISGFTNESIDFGPFLLEGALGIDEFNLSENSKIIFGNPGSELNAYIRVVNNNKINAKVYDNSGRIVSTPLVTIDGDIAHIYDPLTRVEKGIYFIQINGGSKQFFKFLKSNDHSQNQVLKIENDKIKNKFSKGLGIANYKFSWNGIDIETAIQDIEILEGTSNDIIINVSNAEVLEAGLTYTNVSIELPEASTYSADNLALASLFTEGELVINNQGKVVVFDEDSMEMAFATNAQGEIILLSYLNPSISDNLVLNTESTALALVMMHPWTFDLSSNAKQEAIEYIKNLPEFNSYLDLVENSIASNALNPLEAQVVLSKVSELQNIIVKDLIENIDPLQFNITGSTAQVKNISSSASYSVGLYDQNNVLLVHKFAKGQDKSYSIFQDFFDSKLDSSEVADQTASFDLTADGEYNLKAKSGLSFDGSLENQQAAFYNTKNLAGAVIGIFSGKLKKLIIKSDCMIQAGDNLYNGVDSLLGLKGSIEFFKNGNISGFSLTKDVVTFIKAWADGFSDVMEKCSPGYISPTEGGFKFVPGVFGKIFQVLDVLSKAQSAFNGGAMLADWIQYDKEIEYCFAKNGTNINTCIVSISAISPIVQVGRPNEGASPLIVKVTDSNGNAVVGREVFWRTVGLGSSINDSSISDSNGEAIATWTFGTYYDESGQGGQYNINTNQAYSSLLDVSGNEIPGPTFRGDFLSISLRVGGTNIGTYTVNGSVIFEIGGNSVTFTVTDNIITGGTPHLGQPALNYYWLSFPDMTSVEGTITTSFNRDFNLEAFIPDGDYYNYTITPSYTYLIQEGFDPNQTFPLIFTVK